MTCDMDNFYVTTDLHAYSDEEEIFTRRWTLSFERDHA